MSNGEISRLVETSDKWIRERTGIRKRRIASDGEPSSVLGLKAAKRALKQAGLHPSKLDLIVVGTASPDMIIPSTACLIQAGLKAGRAAAFDLSAACSGFIYSLAVADSMISSGAYKNALVVGVDELSRYTDFTDRNTCILFGDGAGAVVLARSSGGRGILSCHLFSDGSGGGLLRIPAGGSLMPASRETVEKRMHYIKMEGSEIFKLAVRAMAGAAVAALRANGKRVGDIDIFIPHQANIRIIQSTAKSLGMEMDRVFVNIDKYGNTSAASVPLAMDEAARSGRISIGDTVLLASFGAGLCWASALIKW